MTDFDRVGRGPSRPRRNARPRDELGRPLPYGSPDGVDGPPEGVVRDAPETLREAQRLLDAGRPFHAHEVLEDAWKSASEPERALWRGLAQLAVGITHAARGNRAGALALLRRGASGIAPYSATRADIDVPALLAWTDDAMRSVDSSVPTMLTAPPLLADRMHGGPD